MGEVRVLSSALPYGQNPSLGSKVLVPTAPSSGLLAGSGSGSP